MAQTTLEEVFIYFAKKQEEETGRIEGVEYDPAAESDMPPDDNMEWRPSGDITGFDFSGSQVHIIGEQSLFDADLVPAADEPEMV